jgi:hypothetical protein
MQERQLQHDRDMSENKWNMIRQYRNELLSLSEWTQLPDAPLTPEEKQSWSIYRHALRDLPQKYGNPDNVIYPEQPERPPLRYKLID